MADKAANGKLDKDPNAKSVQIGEIPDYCNSSGSSVNELVNGVCSRGSPSPPASRRRLRTMSGSKSEHHLLTTRSGRDLAVTVGRAGKRLLESIARKLPGIIYETSESTCLFANFLNAFTDKRGKLSVLTFLIKKIYTKGRPPWYDKFGNTLKQPYVIGICGGSASGKTTVAEKIIEKLEIPWVTILSMDSFYKVLNEEEHLMAEQSNYNFDHPNAFDFDLLCE
ncbi:hypothetical protein ANCDUO_10478, partial [Ancylostoma duodenale]